MIIRLHPVAHPKLCHLTPEQLAEAAANLVVEFDCNVGLATFSPTPPADTSLPWVPLDTCGGAPLGKVRIFRGGEWV
jgi:hypothetical protein